MYLSTYYFTFRFSVYLSCSIPKRVCQCGDQRSVANVLWQEGLGIKHQLVHFPSFGRFLDQSDLFRLVYAKKFDTWTKGFTFRSILLNMPTKPTKEWEHCVYLVVVPTTRFWSEKRYLFLCIKFFTLWTNFFISITQIMATITWSKKVQANLFMY